MFLVKLTPKKIKWKIWYSLREKTNLEEKNVELKIANWTFKIGEFAELKIANGQSIAWIVELKNAKKHFWAENKELKIAKQFN